MFFFDPPENIRKPKFFWCFLGAKKEAMERNGLSKIKAKQNEKQNESKFWTFVRICCTWNKYNLENAIFFDTAWMQQYANTGTVNEFQQKFV